MKVVFTCGCYDLFHEGHLETLKEAKKLGDYLIVGISPDYIVRKAKGVQRPIINQEARVKIISAIKEVDEVVLGTEDDFVNFIYERKPDIYLKGGDYNINTINADERFAMGTYGGEIAFSKLVEGANTTKIIKGIKK